MACDVGSDPAGVELLDLLGIGEEVRELAAEECDLVRRQREAGEPRQTLDVCRGELSLARGSGTRNRSMQLRFARHGGRFDERPAGGGRGDLVSGHARRARRARSTAISPPCRTRRRFDVRRIIAPHAGIMFSGPVAAYAYKAAAAASPYDVVALVGPSHFVAFDGVALYPGGAFETPLGLAQIDGDGVAALAASAIVHKRRGPHEREHSLEMQLPFLRRLLPDVPIVPMLMGFQRRRDDSRPRGRR